MINTTRVFCVQLSETSKILFLDNFLSFYETIALRSLIGKL